MKKISPLLLGLFLLSSCCTVRFNGWKILEKETAVPLAVDANVDGALVYMNGKYMGKTPYTHWGEKAKIRKITVKKDGYVTLSQRTKRRLDPNIFCNLSPVMCYYILPYCLNPGWIWGGLLDLATGAGYSNYKKDFYYFELKRN